MQLKLLLLRYTQYNTAGGGLVYTVTPLLQNLRGWGLKIAAKVYSLRLRPWSVSQRTEACQL
jgi:hypothetical protein